jgi:hypothetical protein
MSKFSRIVVLVTALASSFAVMPSTAGATTFTNTGGTSFHAVGDAGTLTATRHPGVGSNLSCTASTVTGTIPSGVFTSETITETFSPCLLTGNPAHVHCHYTMVPTVITVNPPPAIEHGHITGTCTVRIVGSAMPLCHIEGTTLGSYINPVLPSTTGRLTLRASSSMTVTHANGATSCSSLLGTTPSGPAHLTERTVTLAGPASGNPFIVSP